MSFHHGVRVFEYDCSALVYILFLVVLVSIVGALRATHFITNAEIHPKDPVGLDYYRHNGGQRRRAIFDPRLSLITSELQH